MELKGTQGGMKERRKSMSFIKGRLRLVLKSFCMLPLPNLFIATILTPTSSGLCYWIFTYHADAPLCSLSAVISIISASKRPNQFPHMFLAFVTLPFYLNKPPSPLQTTIWSLPSLPDSLIPTTIFWSHSTPFPIQNTPLQLLSRGSIMSINVSTCIFRHFIFSLPPCPLLIPLLGVPLMKLSQLSPPRWHQDWLILPVSFVETKAIIRSTARYTPLPHPSPHLLNHMELPPSPKRLVVMMKPSRLTGVHFWFFLFTRNFFLIYIFILFRVALAGVCWNIGFWVQHCTRLFVLIIF